MTNMLVDTDVNAMGSHTLRVVCAVPSIVAVITLWVKLPLAAGILKVLTGFPPENTVVSICSVLSPGMFDIVGLDALNPGPIAVVEAGRSFDWNQEDPSVDKGTYEKDFAKLVSPGLFVE